MLVGVFVVAEVENLFLGEDPARGEEEEGEERERGRSFIVGSCGGFCVELCGRLCGELCAGLCDESGLTSVLLRMGAVVWLRSGNVCRVRCDSYIFS